MGGSDGRGSQFQSSPSHSTEAEGKGSLSGLFIYLFSFLWEQKIRVFFFLFFILCKSRRRLLGLLFCFFPTLLNPIRVPLFLLSSQDVGLLKKTRFFFVLRPPPCTKPQNIFILFPPYFQNFKKKQSGEKKKRVKIWRKKSEMKEITIFFLEAVFGGSFGTPLTVKCSN